MPDTLLNPDDFAAHLNHTLDAVKVIINEPLEQLVATVEHNEKRPDLDAEKRHNLRATARLLSACVFLRETVRMGGKELGEK